GDQGAVARGGDPGADRRPEHQGDGDARDLARQRRVALRADVERPRHDEAEGAARAHGQLDQHAPPHEEVRRGHAGPMRPSEKLKLIQLISGSLEALDWVALDLTLRQFGLPWDEVWDGDKASYCVEHVEHGADDTLLDLYEHLHGAKFEALPHGDGAHL